jgi:hypothetical protein
MCIECDKCGKWRLLRITPSMRKPGNRWTCSQHPARTFAHCDAGIQLEVALQSLQELEDGANKVADTVEAVKWACLRLLLHPLGHFYRYGNTDLCDAALDWPEVLDEVRAFGYGLAGAFDEYRDSSCGGGVDAEGDGAGDKEGQALGSGSGGGSRFNFGGEEGEDDDDDEEDMEGEAIGGGGGGQSPKRPKAKSSSKAAAAAAAAAACSPRSPMSQQHQEPLEETVFKSVTLLASAGIVQLVQSQHSTKPGPYPDVMFFTRYVSILVIS